MNQNKPDNKKGGRPRKTSSTRKSKTIGVCFSELELSAIKYRAKRVGLPVSVYCRDAILNAKIIEPMKKEDIQILKGLANMGNNLNQFVKIARFANLTMLENEVLKLIRQFSMLIEKLSDDWRNYKRKKF